ncbi:MAG: hypothetical protein KC418_14750 [Anaerolineales bacterium]|nr:hypothetical protein [Anaerolineales bacterium]MCB8954475.1 hypothetical protein [Ardenticatenales bacterium]
MNKKQYDTGSAPTITVSECLGDLVVKGWSDNVLYIQGDPYEVTESEKGYGISCRGSLSLRVPVGANLFLEQVRGDLIVKNVEGDVNAREVNGSMIVKIAHSVTIENVYGSFTGRNIDGLLTADKVMHSLSLRNVASMEIDTVHGDFSARYVEGSVQVNHVMGDASLNTVNGNVMIERCAGDANLRNLGGATRLDQIGGDLRLTGSLSPGKHVLRTGGNILLRWPPDAPLDLTATASSIVRRMEFDSATEEKGRLMARLGDGETNVVLEAGGEIVIKPLYESRGEWDSGDVDDFDVDISLTMEGLGEMLSTQLDSRLQEMSTRLRTQFGPEFSTKMAQKAEKAVERALKRVERAQERARRQYAPPPPPPPKPSRTRKTSTEEQLKVLQMLEKGLISVEEATTLLEALSE